MSKRVSKIVRNDIISYEEATKAKTPATKSPPRETTLVMAPPVLEPADPEAELAEPVPLEPEEPVADAFPVVTVVLDEPLEELPEPVAFAVVRVDAPETVEVELELDEELDEELEVVLGDEDLIPEQLKS